MRHSMSQVLEAKLATVKLPVFGKHRQNPLVGAAGIRLLGWTEGRRSDRALHRAGRTVTPPGVLQEGRRMPRPGNLYGCEYKGGAGERVCKVMKTKGERTRLPLKETAIRREPPHPRSFA